MRSDRGKFTGRPRARCGYRTTACPHRRRRPVTITTIPSSAGRSLLRHMPLLGLALAAIAGALLAAGPIGWRTGWLHYRFALQTLIPWAGYFGAAALVVSALSLLFIRRRTEWRRIAVAVLAFAAGGLVAYVPWHYDAMRQTVPR